MLFLYNISITIIGLVIKLIAPFSKKMTLLVKGQQQTFLILQKIKPSDEVVWFHCASLGEFEQGRPLIEKIKQKFPNYKVVLTFFSPSGYEVRKNYEYADVVCYLPLDTRKNAKKFLKAVQPKWSFFIKYEFWPNLLNELKEQENKTFLVSGVFRENQLFFKPYGKWMRELLKAFSYFFVQDQKSKKLLKNIGYSNTIVSGDTRFDRVFEITQQNNKLSFVEEFTNGYTTLVAGSTWKEDEKMLTSYINKKADENQKFIIAPHNIKKEEIRTLQKSISKKTILFSEKENYKPSDFQVLIVDSIGILTKIYSYADIAYVGGGYTKSGIHNVLEPATFGVPVLIGPNYCKYNEAVDLVRLKNCFCIKKFEEFSVLLETLFKNKELRSLAGNKGSEYVKQKKGAINIILDNI